MNINWKAVVKLGKSEVQRWLGVYGIEVDKTTHYLKQCSALYQHIIANNITKLEEKEEDRFVVIRRHVSQNSYYGLPIARLLVRNIKTGEEFWTGSNAGDNIVAGEIVRECVDSQGYPTDFVNRP